MADDSSSGVESVMDKIKEKLRHDGDSDGSSSSSSDSDSDISSKVKSKISRLFGRQKPLHSVFGGGKRTLPFLFLFFLCVASRVFRRVLAVFFVDLVIGSVVFLVVVLVCGSIRSVVLGVMLDLFSFWHRGWNPLIVFVDVFVEN